MVREIVFFENHFIDFYSKQPNKVKGKIQFVLDLISQVDRIPEKFFKHLTGFKGLYEIRVDYQSNIYRIFCFFDKGKLVILLNGYQKKTNKTSKSEIEKAVKLMNKYFENEKK